MSATRKTTRKPVAAKATAPKRAALRTVGRKAAPGEAGKLKMDLITFEVMRNAFVAACYEASTTIERIAYHPVIGMGRDRSNALLTPDGRLVAHGHTDAAAHYASFEPSVQELMKDIPKSTMRPGDTYLFSDPYRTGSHVNDVRMIRPIFHGGEIVAFACTVIHWADMGGPMPGTFNPEATTCYAEGIRIPPIRLFKNDRLDEELFSLIEINIRGAVERRADLRAQFEAARLIDRRVKELCDRYGRKTLAQAFEEQFDYSERLMLAELKQLPDGEWEFEDYGDQDVMAEGKPPIRVHCRLTKKGTQMTFDWRDSDPQPRASWGGSRAVLIGGNYLGFMICFPQLFPLNHGIIRNLEVLSKPGTCVHVEFPAPTTGYCSGAFDKVEAVTIGCLAGPMGKVQPWRVYPASVSLTNLCMGGFNPRTKKPFVQYTYARGGFGLVRELTVLTDVTMTIHGDREKFTPFGISGGLNGGGSMLVINKGTNHEFNAGMYATGVELKAGDRIYYSSAGGGGFGDPLEREPELVLNDVMDEWLTVEAARNYYGVVIETIDAEACQYRIDYKATEALRGELARKGFPEGTGAHQVHPIGKTIRPAWVPTEEEVQPHITVSRPPGW